MSIQVSCEKEVMANAVAVGSDSQWLEHVNAFSSCAELVSRMLYEDGIWAYCLEPLEKIDGMSLFELGMLLRSYDSGEDAVGYFLDVTCTYRAKSLAGYEEANVWFESFWSDLVEGVAAMGTRLSGTQS